VRKMDNILGGVTDILVIVMMVVIVVLVIFLILQGRKLNRLEERLYRLSAGSDGESLENLLVENLENYEELGKTLERNTGDIRDIYRRLHSVIQKTGLVKYDAFSQMGGNLSSVIALLDQDNNGVLLNTVQNVDGCYSYVKEIQNGRSDVSFTEEERKAMDIAMDQSSSAGRKARTR
jgi:hypothetical protein